jgi:hypothetical protein
VAEADDAREFFASLDADFDTTAPLGWCFMLKGAAEDRVGPLMDTLTGMGFSGVEPMDDGDTEGRYILWFQEVRVHTADSFAARVAAVEELATREQLELWDYSAGWPEEDAEPGAAADGGGM